jgi:hypothetical protein
MVAGLISSAAYCLLGLVMVAGLISSAAYCLLGLVMVAGLISSAAYSLFYTYCSVLSSDDRVTVSVICVFLVSMHCFIGRSALPVYDLEYDSQYKIREILTREFKGDYDRRCICATATWFLAWSQ